MSDRFYEQIGRANNLTGHTEIMAFCLRPRHKSDRRTKAEIADSIGIPGTDALTKEDMLWLEDNIQYIHVKIEGKLKKDYVSKLRVMFPEIDWNKLTLKTIKGILEYEPTRD